MFVATDIHSPAIVNISHDANDDGDNLNLYELVSGPLSAIPVTSNPLDPTINATYLYNESKIFNFGHVTVQRDSNSDVNLIYEVIDSNGLVRPNSRLSIPARSIKLTFKKPDLLFLLQVLLFPLLAFLLTDLGLHHTLVP